ncbi:TPA: oxidoreductase [Candidatus Sumerlaeota bacterium]|jgi:ech hydrogenase subunit A|nr:oxidoreductase [Candidatus Sumerlaeota bacterium]
MTPLLLSLLVVAPVVFGALAWFLPDGKARKGVVAFSAIFMIALGIFTATQGAFHYELGSWAGPASLLLEAAIMALVLGIAVKVRSWPIGIMVIFQLVVAVAEHVMAHEGAEHGVLFILDPLSTILMLTVSVVGSVIVYYAIGYMDVHAHHAPPTNAGNGRFFFILIGFLGMMNGLVLADNLRWLTIFWEATTLCSFLLIGHDGTEIARANAKRALLINTFGACGMSLASFTAATAAVGATGTLTGITTAHLIIPMAFLCLAAFTKSAQLPFQSWLLGAMVAPTPVSALLHSATMVKAGSYLVLRLAPAFAGERFMVVVAVVGAFTFAVTSALAVSQSNAKKVLAYSTIGNLGLIVACAGIGTPLAYTAALMILCFHAISKGLLFLCVGTIEQQIGSRDIEDMGGILFKLPMTTTITMIGQASMLIPPFGMLMSKWLAMEASIQHPVMLVLVVLGAALTVFFWCKWLGRIQTASFHSHYTMEKLPTAMLVSVVILAVGVVGSALAILPLFHHVFVPVAAGAFKLSPSTLAPLNDVIGFVVWPVVITIVVALALTLLTRRKITEAHVSMPFLCGENVKGTESYLFRGPMEQTTEAWAGTFYFLSIFDETRITQWSNLVAGLLLLTLLGVIKVL